MAVSDNRNPDNKTADEIMANLVPGAIAIPAVFELVRLQERGYHLVVNH